MNRQLKKVTQYHPIKAGTAWSRRRFLDGLAIGSASLLLQQSVRTDPSTEKRPNILFAIADDWSFGHAGAYGCNWVKTPAFDRVAKEGILFTRGYTPDAKCAPSRSCILTGRNPWQLKEACNHWCFFPPEFKSFPETLAENGYFTGFTGKGWAPGVAKDQQGKQRRMTGTAFQARSTAAPTPGISNCDYAGNFEDFIQAVPQGTSWCFWYGGHEPHRAYEYGSGVKKGGKKASDIKKVAGFWPDNDTIRNDMLDYALEVEHFDQHLGRILDLLEKQGKLENTLVVVTSDNGMPFPRAKGYAYAVSNHMPLAIMWKQGIRNPGQARNDYVSFIDFAPTFIEAAGIRWDRSGMVPAAGRSLADVFASRSGELLRSPRDYVLVGRERNDVGRPNDEGYPIRGIIKEEMLYLVNFEPGRWPGGNPETGYLDTDGSPTKTEVLRSRQSPEKRRFWDLCFGKRPAEELYRLKEDSDCLVNLEGEETYRKQKQALRTKLFQELKNQQDPRMLGQGHVFDQYPYADPATKNFYERMMRGEKVRANWVNDSDFERPK